MYANTSQSHQARAFNPYKVSFFVGPDAVCFIFNKRTLRQLSPVFKADFDNHDARGIQTQYTLPNEKVEMFVILEIWIPSMPHQLALAEIIEGNNEGEWGLGRDLITRMRDVYHFGYKWGLKDVANIAIQSLAREYARCLLVPTIEGMDGAYSDNAFVGSGLRRLMALYMVHIQLIQRGDITTPDGAVETPSRDPIRELVAACPDLSLDAFDAFASNSIGLYNPETEMICLYHEHTADEVNECPGTTHRLLCDYWSSYGDCECQLPQPRMRVSRERGVRQLPYSGLRLPLSELPLCQGWEQRLQGLHNNPPQPSIEEGREVQVANAQGELSEEPISLQTQRNPQGRPSLIVRLPTPSTPQTTTQIQSLTSMANTQTSTREIRTYLAPVLSESPLVEQALIDSDGDAGMDVDSEEDSLRNFIDEDENEEDDDDMSEDEIYGPGPRRRASAQRRRQPARRSHGRSTELSSREILRLSRLENEEVGTALYDVLLTTTN